MEGGAIADFMCDIGGCERGFGSLSGLRLHQRRTHEVVYHSGVATRISSQRSFWTEEEVTTLVNMEVEWVMQGFSGRGRGTGSGRGAVTLNGLLKDRLGSRTLDAIKGQMRRTEYRLSEG